MSGASPFKDYFQILKISPSADTPQIRSAYRKLAKESHPDVNSKGSSVLNFQEIQEAYEILKEPASRKEYLIRWKNQQTQLETLERKKKLKKIRIECQVIFYRHTTRKLDEEAAFLGFEKAFHDLERTWTMKDQDLEMPSPESIYDWGNHQEKLDQMIDDLYRKRLAHREIDGWEFQGDLLIKSFLELGNHLEECLERIRYLLHDLPDHLDNFRTGYAIYSMDEDMEIWNRDSLGEYSRLITILENLYNEKASIGGRVEKRFGRIDGVLHIRRLYLEGYKSAGISRQLHYEVKPREIEGVLKVLKCR